MEYKFNEIEKKWQDKWNADKVYKVSNESDKPKFYVLDMFPYPSGAGLHVGHPLGYIASDIYARYKRLKGFNVLHPMGFDSFGLPAEQYALETGQHPAETTKKNIATFKSQLDKIGFCYDWDREIQTSNPNYYKWTQKIFLDLFNSYFCNTQKKARPIAELIQQFMAHGSLPSTMNHEPFTAEEWNSFDEKKQQAILMNYRLAFSKYGEVNWCEALGTVLANDEVVNGVSERGGHPVVKKKMRQWYLRITAYADRLLEGLETVDFSESMKEMQRNWIGRSEGAEMEFEIKGTTDNRPLTTDVLPSSVVRRPLSLRVYTTRPDTIFGVDFMVVAPEHELVNEIKSAEQATAVDEYIAYVKSRSDVDRMAEKKITGCFTGAFAINPFDGKEIPIYISEYVLAGYGTGAIMAVPCGDERDFKFAKHFNIPITNIIGDHFNGEEANPTKEATLQNSGFLNGLLMKDAISVAVSKIEEMGIGVKKVNYKMRDAGFSRQRYWGEPFPIIWQDETAIALEEKDLPLELPHVDKYGPGREGEGPLGNLEDWVNTPEGRRETSTMPGYAGSSWYFLRYMDPKNDEVFCDKKASDYWNQVDVYVGGTEHAVGHLLYSRMWTKVLFDLGYISFDEPFKKLVNQGMIQGVSAFVNAVGFGFGRNLTEKFNETDERNYTALRDKYSLIKDVYISDEMVNYLRTVYVETKNEEQVKHEEIRNDIVNTLTKSIGDEIIALGLEKKIAFQPMPMGIRHYKIHVPINCIDGKNILNTEQLEKEQPRFKDATFMALSDKFYCSREVEKMSKSKLNTINPDDLCVQYGADTFRMYEMFLGPVEASKPWDDKGIEGVHRFLRKLWRLFFDDIKGKVWTDATATDAELKVLHKTIKKIDGDTANFSYNTAVSAFMVCVNELGELKCHKKEILEKLLIILTPYAPHIAEELWYALGNTTTILDATYPAVEEKYLIESSKEYPVSINGKMRTTIDMALDITQEEAEKTVLANEVVQKWLEGKAPKKIIYVKNKMVNVVI